MLRFKRVLYALPFLLLEQEALAVLNPTLPDPGWQDGVPGAYTTINYDYGPRFVTDGSNPHVGIDYDIRTGAKSYACTV